MKAHIGVDADADSGLVHTVCGTAGHVADATEGNSLLHGNETVVFADADYQGADKRPDAVQGVRWQVAMRSGKRKKLDKAGSPIDALMDKIEKSKARVRAKVEHPFRVIKRQFGFVKVRYRGLKRNTLQLKTLFALFAPVDGQAPSSGNAGVNAAESKKTAPEQDKKALMPPERRPRKAWIESWPPRLNKIKPAARLTLSSVDFP